MEARIISENFSNRWRTWLFLFTKKTIFIQTFRWNCLNINRKKLTVPVDSFTRQSKQEETPMWSTYDTFQILVVLLLTWGQVSDRFITSLLRCTGIQKISFIGIFPISIMVQKEENFRKTKHSLFIYLDVLLGVYNRFDKGARSNVRVLSWKFHVNKHFQKLKGNSLCHNFILLSTKQRKNSHTCGNTSLIWF